MRTVFWIFVNGILTPKSNPHAWTDDAKDWVITQLHQLAEKYEYTCDAIFRRMGQRQRVIDLAALIAKAIYPVRLAVHSNGGDIAVRFFQQFGYVVDELHLIAAACEPDFEKNGLNKAIAEKRLNRCYVYCSKNDEYLKLATWSTRLFGWAGFGYGNCGLVGPQNMSEEAKAVTTIIWWEKYHSGCWKPENFDSTLRLITHTPSK